MIGTWKDRTGLDKRRAWRDGTSGWAGMDGTSGGAGRGAAGRGRTGPGAAGTLDGPGQVTERDGAWGPTVRRDARWAERFWGMESQRKGPKYHVFGRIHAIAGTILGPFFLQQTPEVGDLATV